MPALLFREPLKYSFCSSVSMIITKHKPHIFPTYCLHGLQPPLTLISSTGNERKPAKYERSPCPTLPKAVVLSLSNAKTL